ncbi:MAG: GNAT family N-acetyltransferase [Rhizobiaceae bacterium]
MESRDAEVVSRLLSESWASTYGPLMGEGRAADASARIHAPALLRAELERGDATSFVAEDEAGSIVGYAYAFRKERDVDLDRLHVVPAMHGSGVAADLLHAVFAAFIGDRQIMLEVLEGNDRAIRFYEKHGFSVGERRNACGGVEGVPTLVMRRALPGA